MTRRGHLQRFGALALALCCAAGARLDAAALSRLEAARLCGEASQLFRQANALRRQDPERARRLYRKAILRMERVAGPGGARNGHLYTNLANAHFFAGDLGEAILWYRRALRLRPSDANTRQNLAYARGKRKDKLETATEQRVLRTVLFWHYDFGPRTRWSVFLAFWGAGWALAALMAWTRRRALVAWPAAVCGLVALAMLGSCVAASLPSVTWREGVVTAREVVARKGDGASYAPSFRTPLHEGVEFRLLERRPEWLRIQLPDGRTCWVQASACRTL